MAGYSDAPLIKKLGLSENSHRIILHAPDDYTSFLLEGHSYNFDKDIKKQFDWLQAFYIEKEKLENEFPLPKHYLIKSGQLWISWPKKSSGAESDLNDNMVRDIGLRNGLVDIKIIAVDETWSGLKFVYRSEL
jgi:hypothetical protein